MQCKDFYTSSCYLDFEALMSRLRTASHPVDETLKPPEEKVAQTSSVGEKETLIEKLVAECRERYKRRPAMVSESAQL